jgi:hypothetical protein
MVKCGVLFEAWAEFLSTIQTSLGFKGLNICLHDCAQLWASG